MSLFLKPMTLSSDPGALSSESPSRPLPPPGSRSALGFLNRILGRHCLLIFSLVGASFSPSLFHTAVSQG